jgi:hypothetical protein
MLLIYNCFVKNNLILAFIVLVFYDKNKKTMLVVKTMQWIA